MMALVYLYIGNDAMDEKAVRQIMALSQNYSPSMSGHLRSGVKDGKTSKYRGVWRKSNGKFIAKIKQPGNSYQTHLGTFDNEDNAGRAYNIAAKAIYGANAYQNDVPSE